MGQLTTGRMRTLLEEAATALADGRDPFGDTFLGAHRVTLTECYTLGNLLATLARGYLRSIEPVQRAIYLAGLADDAKAGGQMAEGALESGLLAHYARKIRASGAGR